MEAPCRTHPSTGSRCTSSVTGTSGEPLVLVHGYTGDVGDWKDQIPEFSRTHRVLVMDHRGHGKSDAPPDRVDLHHPDDGR